MYYIDKKKKRWPLAVAAAALVLLLVLGCWWAAASSGQNLEEEGAAALKAAIQRSALQCYVVEGIYPSSLDYLEESYGLQINREDFYVVYKAFASNLPPEVTVLRRP